MTGFPYLTLAGQFLLKDVVLAAASLMVVATDAARRSARQPEPQAMAAARARTHAA